MTDPEVRKVLGAASHALRSYQYGNAAPDLAGEVADAIDTVMARLKPDEEPPGTCDWGGCDHLATHWRLSFTHGWLPVCFVHAEPQPRVVVVEERER